MTQLWPPRLPPRINYISDPPNLDYCSKKRRRIVILGSTGSIGKNALAVAAQTNKLEIIGLACGSNIELLAEQAHKFRPPCLAVLNDSLATRLRNILASGYVPRILVGPAGYASLASLPDADCVLSAQVGAAGLVGTLAAALAGKVIALANKESLVIAGDLLRNLCLKTGATVLPVDSEHYALFQCIAGKSGQIVKNLILTASGGPFLNKAPDIIARATSAMALKHPNWNMGAKITIDSASLMNKGLEFIEAMHLYGLNPGAIKILVHPQSVVHSLVEFEDNSLLGQFAVPDMRLPIAACLLWPQATQSFVQPLDLIGSLTFQKPDLQTFACLRLAMEAAAFQPASDWAELGVNPACVVLNAANEAAVELFLAEKSLFGQIHLYIEAALKHLIYARQPTAPKLPHCASIPEQALALANLIASLDSQARAFVKNCQDCDKQRLVVEQYSLYK